MNLHCSYEQYVKVHELSQAESFSSLGLHLGKFWDVFLFCVGQARKRNLECVKLQDLGWFSECGFAPLRFGILIWFRGQGMQVDLRCFFYRSTGFCLPKPYKFL
jgi:hypothetical protein